MRTLKYSIKSNSYKQSGVALLILLLIIGVGATYGLLRALNHNNLQIERDNITTQALAQAKEALIGYAINVDLQPLTSARPGELPCPDMTNSGSAINSTGGTTCNLARDRLGRLPWKLSKLQLPDVRDGNGDRLWYAVSGNFKNSTGITSLNSDTNGTLTVKDATGRTVHGDTLQSGVVAVIFSAGSPIVRQGSTQIQNRGCGAGTASCDSIAACPASAATPSTIVPLCNPANYLDTALGNDNASYTEATATTPSTTGFIQGEVRNGSGNIIVNDKFVVITHDELMSAVEKLVAAEVRLCLTSYAYKAGNANGGRYPWPAPFTDTTAPFASTLDTTFGRIPDPPFTSLATGMDTQFNPSFCSIGPSTSSTNWWAKNKWYSYVFYGVAPARLPSASPNANCGSCLTIFTPDPAVVGANKEIVIVAAGRAMNSQSRSAAVIDPINYFERQNATPYDTHFYHGPIAQDFNDQVLFFPK